ncbi:MAG: putative O-succinylbenzoate--CoA ligase (OSB-CoA synthetase) (O-succinylbenzoyl-CoA synthetase) [Frankiales bacterium]|jgi:acyl-CoA synthetase (AMP-forming)/AMP-acid ligase II|nr:putative O-succinylbenzoate--CoA ligase (OSB-CoA synthetase) (O-succinylbenzoyl-CoA synthetase) [Frankiales bacterium]
MDLSLILGMAADGFPDRVAIGSSDSGLTFAALHARVERLAAALPAGRPVVYVGPHGEHAATLLFAASAAGSPFAPVNGRLPREQVVELVRRLDPALVVCTPDLETALNSTAPLVLTTARLDDLERVDVPASEPSDVAVLLYTSGTTAAPKAAVLTHENLLAYVMETLDFGSAGDDECLLLAVPPFHVAGIAAVLSNAYLGRRVVALPAFDPNAWLQAVRDESVTHAFVVPTMLARIVAALRDNPTLAGQSLRTLSYGGARTPGPVLEEALALFPEVQFVNAYGLTETSSTIAVLGPEDHRPDPTDPVAVGRLASVGQVVPSVEVEIIDEAGRPVSTGRSGRVRMRGAQVGGSYLGTGSTLDREGWLVTGDLGHLDDDGYLFLEGRADDVVIRGGENISAAEVEDALLRCDGVAQAAVVGVPDEEWGERLAAAVVARDGVSLEPDALRARVRELLGSLKTPDQVVLREDLPLTATGKVLKRVLRDELVASLQPTT